jgi:hypothetical protein
MTINYGARTVRHQDSHLRSGRRCFVLTAMSALSARTYSWGGEAGRLGSGGETGSLVGSAFGAGLKYLSRPVGLFTTSDRSSSSLAGGDDSEELSETDIAALVRDLTGRM